MSEICIYFSLNFASGTDRDRICNLRLNDDLQAAKMLSDNLDYMTMILRKGKGTYVLVVIMI
jgi:hypothetical protein